MGGYREHEERVTESSKVYRIDVGGSLDEWNTLQYGRQAVSRFQPNVLLSIENTGNTIVRNPRIVINGRRDWYSADRIVRDAVPAKASDEEKTFSVWNFVRANLQEGRTYNTILEGPDGSITRFLNACGTGACGTFHGFMPRLLALAGVRTCAGYLSFGAHAAQKEIYEGSDHYLDAMLPAGDSRQPRGHFPLALDNRTIPGIMKVLRDRYLIDRCGIDALHFRNVAYFGRDCNFWPCEYSDPHAIQWELRPGERIEFSWEECARSWSREPLCAASGNGNGRVTYSPADPPPDGIVEMRCPYPVTGASVSGCWEAGGSVEVAFGEGGFEPVWRGEGPVTLELDSHRPEWKEPVYTTFLRFRFTGARTRPVVVLWFQTYLRSLPSLSCGENRVLYEDDSETPASVRIVHRWREAETCRIPQASPARVSGRESSGVFRWRAPGDGPEIGAWEFYLSPRKDLLHPLLSNFHVVTGEEPMCEVERFGAFNPSQTYYWRVRPRSRDGVWGPWSETWTFRADVPGRVTDLTVRDDGEGNWRLLWSPAPGTGVRYEVFGSDEDGFTPRLQDGRGLTGQTDGEAEIPLPRNCLGESDRACFDITRCPAAFFRVVAVSGDGNRSAPSDCVSAPHPKVLPLPLDDARVGVPYRHRLSVRASGGRWIINIRKGIQRGFLRYGGDRLRFGLVAAPGWLRVDERTGDVHGTPGAEDEGLQDLFVEVMEGNGRGYSTQLYLRVLR